MTDAHLPRPRLHAGLSFEGLVTFIGSVTLILLGVSAGAVLIGLA